MRLSPPPPNATSLPDGDVLDDLGFRRLLRRASTTLIVALLLPTVLLLGLVLFLRRSAHWVDHTDQVISEAHHVETLLVTMQSGFRGFRLMRDDTLLVPFRAARNEITGHFRTLAGLVGDNPSQLAILAQAQAETDAWVKAADETLARLAAGQTEEEQRPSMVAARSTFNAAVARIHTFLEREELLRAQRSRTLDRVFTALMLSFGVAALLGVPLLPRWLRRLLRRVSATYQSNLVRAESANRAKDDFLAALSHELRTPLTPVLMTSATLREDARLPADAREQLGMMERNIALEARLIDDLLDLTAVSRGKLQLRPQPCDAHSLIGLAFEIVRADATAKAIKIERAFAAPHGGLLADPARFQQVIWNLLRNAVKFTPEGGWISIRTSEEKKPGGAAWLRIEVADSGIGIDPALLDRIFLPFDQGHLAGDHRFGGLGLGLAIARAIVELHGGQITAQSAGVNQGATFVVELPGVTATPPGLQPQASADLVPPPANRLRLLLVEDHVSTLQTLQRLLTRDGHQVVSAASITEALAAANATTFDLVISDLGLPDGTGTELMEKLRDAHRLRGIALSGYGMEEDLARSAAAGFVTHLVKPVHFAELRGALASFSALKAQGAGRLSGAHEA